MYWYLSEQKIRLINEAERSWLSWPQQLTLTLKEPFSGTEAEFGAHRATETVAHLKTLRKKLKEQSIPNYDAIQPGKLPLMCRFSGPAARVVDRHGFWAALATDNAALLLAGSHLNTVGASTSQDGIISPSADPVGAVRAAFHGAADAETGSEMSIQRRLSYSWQSVWRVANDALAKPSAEGVAVVAGLYPADAAEVRRAGMRQIDRLVVASPIFVEQTG